MGILEKVDYSPWATPIVVVPKKDGKIIICGDYMVTVNRVLEVDRYPLPKPEDVFATLSGGETFTALDRSQAYQQLLLDEESPSTSQSTHIEVFFSRPTCHLESATCATVTLRAK